MKMKIKLVFPLLAVIFTVSCREDIAVVSNPEDVLKVAMAVDCQKLFPWVELLSENYLIDKPIDNEGYPPKDKLPTDHLSNTLSFGIISKALTDMGYDVDTVDLGIKPVARNLTAELKGTLYPEEVVLVGAHLDAYYGGADDNATALAALLEIARAVKKFSFARTIRFVAFDLEELGSVGSTRYVEAGYADDVVDVIMMDMLGYSSEEPGSQSNLMGVKVPDRANYILVAGNANSADQVQMIVNFAGTSKIAKTVGIIAPDKANYFLSSIFTRSDHGLMWYNGKKGLLFSDGAETRNENYHKPTDLPETLNPDFLSNNTKLIAAAVAIIAEVQP